MIDYKEEFYESCVYAGILHKLEFETKLGTDDKTDQFQYAIERYCTEHQMTGGILKEELEKYKKAVKEREEYRNSLDVSRE